MKLIRHIPTKFLQVKAKIDGKYLVAPEGTWVSGGGHEVPSIIFCVGQRFVKVVCEKNLTIRKRLKNQ